jgi:protein-tyrosine-phosphatase
MAEGLLRHHLDGLGVTARVDSGGLLPGGSPATPHAVEVLAERGIDIAGHASRPLAEVGLAGADLIVTMERRHLQEAIVLEPSVRNRTFTLPELVRRAEAAPPRQRGEDLRSWAARISAGRTGAELLGTGDGVEDPIGRPRASYVETAALLDDLLRRVVARAWPAEVLAA